MSYRRTLAWTVALAVVLVSVLLLVPDRSGTAAAAGGRDQLVHPRTVAASRRILARDGARPILGELLSRAPAGSRWLASWGGAPQPADVINGLSVHGLDNQTLREVVLLSSPGAAIRVHLSNRYGDRPLVIGRVTVAAAGASGTLLDAPQALTFAGRSEVVIPEGAETVSDPLAMRVPALGHLAVSVYLPVETGSLTDHATAQEDAYIGGGNAVSNTTSDWVGATATSWYLLTGVDTLSPPRYAGTIVAFGDSITAGFQSTLNSFGAWPDDLARRLTAERGPRLSVVDEGISGNRILSSDHCCGVSGERRFDSDVLAQAGVRAVIVLEGINDIGYREYRSWLTAPHTVVSATQIISGDEHLIAAAHAAGVRIYGATLLPFRGSAFWTPAGEAEREAVNHWILHSHAFNGVIDFAAVMAAPGDPEVLDPRYDSGDHLHPDNAGYAAMARAVDLRTILAGVGGG